MGNSRRSTTEKKPVRCYSCNQEGHFTRDCTNLCKLCNQQGHKHYECVKYQRNSVFVNNKNNNAEVSSSEQNLLVEEVLMAANNKRQRFTISGSETNKQGELSGGTRNHVNKRISRSGKAVDIISKSRKPVRISEAIPIRVQSMPKHPTYRNEERKLRRDLS